MSKPRYTTEVVHKVYNDETGDYIEVGPDADHGDLLEIRQVEQGKIVARITGEPEQIQLVAQAILKLAPAMVAAKESA